MDEFSCSVSVESELSLPPEVVWAKVSTMAGVNAELMPWVRMTVPRGLRGLSLGDAPVGEPLFQSWIMVAGCVPIDRHQFCLEFVEDGHFRERSSSWLQSVWCHERWVVPTERGCRVIDELRFSPRLSLAAPLARAIVQRVFEHRHRRLSQWSITG